MSLENRNFQQQTDLFMSLCEDVRALDVKIVDEEASLGDWKRVKAREWMGALFGGLLECSEKGSVAATSGRAIIECLPTDMTQPGLARAPYSGHSRVGRLVAEAERKLQRILEDIPGLSPSPPSLSILQTPKQPTQTHASSSVHKNPRSDLYDSDFGEYNPHPQSQAYTPGQQTRLSSVDKSGFTIGRQPSPTSAGRELRRVSFVGGFCDGTSQPPNEFRIDDILELSQGSDRCVVGRL